MFHCRGDDVIPLPERPVDRNVERLRGIIGKNDLIQEVWGYSADVYTHTVETHIYRLRQKVEHDDTSAQLIITSDGGYSLKF